MQFPDPHLTPGESSEEWSVRDVPMALKRQVYQSYRISLIKRPLYVIDHLIPLELRGTNGIKNLWPQPRKQAKLKDKDEDRLAKAVLTGKYTIKDAQAEILRLWR